MSRWQSTTASLNMTGDPAAGPVTVTCDVQHPPRGGVSVRFGFDGSNIAIDTIAPFTTPVTVPPGAHVITAAVRDRYGVIVANATLPVTVAAPAPPPAPTPDPVPPPPVPATVLPYFLRLVVPADKRTDQVIHSPAGDYTVTQAKDQLVKMAAMWSSWLFERCGLRPNFDVDVLLTKMTLAELQTEPSNGIRKVDEFGEGFNISAVLEHAMIEDPKIAAAGWLVTRLSAMVVWGGGVAGGACISALCNPPANPAGIDRGYACIGDVEFSNILTGTLDPWSLAHDIPDATRLGRSWSHEMLHSLGVYCHAGDCFDADSATAAGLNPAQWASFAVPSPSTGAYERINEFACFPLQVCDASTVQCQSERRLYPGALAQLKKFSGRFVG